MTTAADDDHADLVRALLVERYARNDWWTRKPSRPEETDDELTCARRRRVLVKASAHIEHEETA